ncbi:MAG: EamA family transporter [Chloracidobacterium sp.]|uniref:EamA family transporter n=1 Tax=Chloracidobacterium validum TaxID=2821543 RepID=A0ABX8BCL1_9BACT|nr:EamA family transporter [Chloracidobacterium validum]QUW04658.1 EamA family transporter [Chloracidobacterium validum]
MTASLPTVVALIAGIVVCGTLGDLTLSRTMKQVGQARLQTWRDALGLAWRTLRAPGFYVGGGCMAGAFVALLAALSIAPVSLVEPATSVSFVLNTLGARFILKERVNRTRWVGTLLVTGGAYLLFF